MNNKDTEYRIQNLKACIEYEQHRISKENRQGITVNIQLRLNTINKLQKELDTLIIA